MLAEHLKAKFQKNLQKKTLHKTEIEVSQKNQWNQRPQIKMRRKKGVVLNLKNLFKINLKEANQ